MSHSQNQTKETSVNNPTLALSPALERAKGFCCVLEGFKHPTIKICAWCDPTHESTKLAVEEGWHVSHGMCVRHYQEEMHKKHLD